MAAINVLVVGDGPFMDQTPTQMEGINFLPSQDLTDNTFTVAEFVYLLRNNPSVGMKVDTAHRRNDPNANFPNFNFATTLSLDNYDVLWLFGYEGWNYKYYGSAIGDDEVAAIATFMANGGGVFATGDHAGMGSYLCGRIPRVRSMRNWFGQPGDIPAGCPTQAVNYAGTTVSAANRPGLSNDPVPLQRGDTLQQNPSDTTTSFEFDDQSDATPQTLSFPNNAVHAILQGENGPLASYPDHMHEGEVVTPLSLSESVTVNGQTFVEYPTVGSYQPAPVIIATGNIVGGHETLVEGAAPLCEQNNFSGDGTPTTTETIGTLCAYDGRAAGVGRIVTDSSFHHFLDLNLIGDPCGSTPDRQQGFAPAPLDAHRDPVAPAATGVLADLQTFYVNTVVWLARFNPDFYFVTDQNTFGFDAASDGATYPTFQNAFWLTVNGYSPDAINTAIGTGALKLSGPFAALGAVSAPGPLQYDHSIPSNQPQPVNIPYNVRFSGSSIAQFPTANNPAKQYLLQATLTIGGNGYAAETNFQLTAGQDPYFLNVNPAQNNVFYLSQDLAVFTVTTNATSTVPVTGGPPFITSNPKGTDNAAAQAYIANLLGYLNGNPDFNTQGASDAFAEFPSQFLTDGDSSVTPSSGGFTNYNFAVARVRLNGPVNSSADGVKVFFRLFVTQTSDTDYNPADTYLSVPDGAGYPGTPLPAPDGETTPFFALGSASSDYASGGPNNQNIDITNSAGAFHYFGCFLNVYDPALNLKMTGTHHCIVAQIACDDAPIVNADGVTAGPENSDKLAQRNMQVTFGDNPGTSPSLRIPQTFDARASAPLSATAGQLLDYPDELLIDWGNVPAGSVASIYWPQALALDILRLASQLYPSTTLTVVDPNTVQCKVGGGYTAIPIPAGSGEKLGGLFTLDLPPKVKKGQEFNIVVRRLSTRQSTLRNAPPVNARATAPGKGTVQRNWRYVVGTFQIKIPIATAKAILPLEENTYAIMLWRFNQMSPGNRWYPVLKRYIGYLAGRVNGLGGNAGGIEPSPWGYGGGGTRGSGGSSGFGGGVGTDELTGKVAGVVYDRFGDFEGFLLRTETGHERAFHAVEPEIEELVRYAWRKRALISVRVHAGHPEIPVSLILRRVPRLEH